MNQCKCVCHENKLKKPYEHNTVCCESMNGFIPEETKCEHGKKWFRNGDCVVCSKRWNHTKEQEECRCGRPDLHYKFENGVCPIPRKQEK